MTEISGSLVGHPQLPTKVVLRYAMVNSGVQCVMTSGETLMLPSFADNWATLTQVYYKHKPV